MGIAIYMLSSSISLLFEYQATIELRNVEAYKTAFTAVGITQGVHILELKSTINAQTYQLCLLDRPKILCLVFLLFIINTIIPYTYDISTWSLQSINTIWQVNNVPAM